MSDTATTTETNMFSGTRGIVDLTSYMLMRGVTDFGDLKQFNLYESGYSFFVVMAIPKFMRQLATTYPDDYGKIINNYAHILEFENRGLSGIDNITSENGQLTNGINSINIINKVNKPSDSTFSASYQEKLGSTITKAHELFLTGIKDPRTQVKTYHGLIGKSKTNGKSNAGMTPGYENEVFRFMYIVCDNTLRYTEKAICIASAQITSVPLEIYNSEKGTYEFKEISVEFNGFPIMGREVNARANKFRRQIFNNTVWNEYDMDYAGISTNNNSIRTNTDKASTKRNMYNTLNGTAQSFYGDKKTTPSE